MIIKDCKYFELNNRIYMIHSIWSNPGMIVFDPKSCKLHCITTDKPPSTFRVGYCAALYTYKIVIFGGINDVGQLLNTL